MIKSSKDSTHKKTRRNNEITPEDVVSAKTSPEGDSLLKRWGRGRMEE